MVETLTTPTLLESLFLLPMSLLAFFACLPLAIKIFNKNEEPGNNLTLAIGVVGIVLAIIGTVKLGRMPAQFVFSEALVFDKIAVFANVGVLIITGLTLILSSTGVNTRGQSFAEHTFLLLLSAVGMLTLTSANDLMVSFVGLEIMSIALYVLIALGHEQKISKEAAFKYFLLGSFASALFLYGIAFVFGLSGSTIFTKIAPHAAALSSNRLFLTGLVLLFAGVAFKVSLFPFHAWTPDVYQGAPTSISGFMATGVKLAMFTLLIRLSSLHFFNDIPGFTKILTVVAVLTMTIGNVTALVQENIKRLVAYSSVAHAGYIMLGVIVAISSPSPEAATATLFYLISYSAMNLGAFAVINIFEKEERGNLSIADYSGLGFKHPFLGACLSIFMLSLAGIPPTVGFLGKFYLFASAIQDGFYILALWGVINSVLSIYYYLKILVYLYMKPESFEVKPGGNWALAKVVVAATAALVLFMGVVSGPFYLPALKGVKALYSKETAKR